MNKFGIFTVLIILLSKVSFAENYQTYNCVKKFFDISLSPTNKFSLKILKYYDDGYVVYSRENILVFGRIRNSNELVGYLYDDNYLQYELFTIYDEQYTHYLFNIDKDQEFPYPNGKSIFYGGGLRSIEGAKQSKEISYELSQNQFDLEKEILLFNYNHLMTILENKKKLLINQFDHTCKR